MPFIGLFSLRGLNIGDTVYYKLSGDERSPVLATVASLPMGGGVSVIEITLESDYEYGEVNYSSGETIVAAEWALYEEG